MCSEYEFQHEETDALGLSKLMGKTINEASKLKNRTWCLFKLQHNVDKSKVLKGPRERDDRLLMGKRRQPAWNGGLLSTIDGLDDP